MKEKKIIILAIILIFLLMICALFTIVYLKKLESKSQSELRPYGKVEFEVPEENKTKENKTKNEIIGEKDVYINSIILQKLINGKWDRLSAKLPEEYEKEEDKYIFGGYTLYCNGLYVKNVIFNKEYDSNVIGHFKVNPEKKEVEKKLGKPTFENKRLNLYGYKTGNVYAFFHDDEISIYPNANLSNSKFEDFVMNYIKGEYEENQTKFVIEIKNEFPDLEAELKGEDVILKSSNRQVEIRLNGNFAETQIILYNGYKGSISRYSEIYNIIEEKKDLTEIIEEERITRK